MRSSYLLFASLITTAFGCLFDATGEGTATTQGGGSTVSTGGAGGGGGASHVGGSGGEGGSNPSSGGASTQTGPGGTVVTDGGGGSPSVSVCGDGIIGADEECDDQNVVPGDGCDDVCAMECASPFLEDPLTHHCYGFRGSGNWDNCDSNCEDEGEYLASLTNEAEFQFVATLLAQEDWPGDIWVGGYQTGDDYAWVSGEPWGLPPKGPFGWKMGEPNNGGGEDHVAIWDPAMGTLQWLADANKNESKDCLCERNPAGG